MKIIQEMPYQVHLSVRGQGVLRLCRGIRRVAAQDESVACEGRPRLSNSLANRTNLGG
jgi:hypothetical protein